MDDVTAPIKFGVGQPVRRWEDLRLLTGRGRYQDDWVLPRQSWCVFVRSPHAHALIRSIDTAAAEAAPGVLAVYTAADYEADGLSMPKANMPRKKRDGSPMFAPQRPALVRDRVRYVGDAVAMVIAETLAQAKDAAELVEVDYDPLPSVTNVAAAAEPDAARVWDENPDNISHTLERGDKAATDAAFARAAHVVRRRYVVTRVHAQYMEPRGALGSYDDFEDRYTLYADVNYPHRVRNMLANNVFRVPESKVRVVVNDVGGGFGAKGWQYVDHRLTLWAARKLGRPVKWRCERSEVIMADEHGRDNIGEIELALDASGKFLAVRLHMLASIGAYIASDRQLLTPFGQIITLTGVYDIPAAHVTIDAVLSNTNPTAPYRGAGRPEAIYLIERIIEAAAEATGIDPIALRRRNVVHPQALPYKAPLGPVYDSGDFARNMDLALDASDYAGFPARQAESASRGKLRGIGFVNAIEQAAGPVPDYAEIRFQPSGSAMMLMGTKSHGQGHETAYKQILFDKLGIDPREVQFIDSDTDRVAFGMGSNGSRSMVVGGSALVLAADKIIAKGKQLAAHMLEAAEADIDFADNTFSVAGTDRAVTLKQVAMASFQPAKLPKGMPPGLIESATYAPEQATYPNGTHVCEVEVDPETGTVQMLNYVVVDDVGTIVNPLTLAGQIHGGVAQGAGQILMEEVVYDRESGQLVTASFMDYAMPRADTMCGVTIKSNPHPTPSNLLGVKGAGEAGCVGALPAVMIAIVNALKPLGVKELDMPATPLRVWQAIQAAKAAGS
ncbi:xanthine dehydrogenase family protein molybdopterin-binding subunit [Rhodopila sp.]|uniref:xanthine dehydrogenase family protein molybdopterin-binding subunit n=1 Tax=Rhodopila sp. TaxID=2480087 RepID=UPI002B8E08C8|nr:xanthine dehydrogenase family protein molybdopterin-binding subunit [Rhodopila sp.]HVZ10146.1 xanthine dehydrogenase family protein molybdopterin-binding subunit [Rhodopila sp.]